MNAEPQRDFLATAGGREPTARAGRPRGADAGPPPNEEAVLEALRCVFDPEIPVNIYDLGLIYRLDVRDNGDVEVDMTLTAPGCPVAGTMPGEVARAVAAVPGAGEVTVELVWDPPWDHSRMTDAAKIELNMF
ncbi:MAG: SUF system Fe-S cluster assembly protein [Alphaproteobacteria bacterium]|nr:SUF system Fe-S cluster assembly protein [Alphaproteobacteria bacterium]